MKKIRNYLNRIYIIFSKMHGTNEPNIIGNELKYIKESLKNEIAIGQYHSLFEKN